LKFSKVAEHIGLDRGEIEKTIRSGLDAGMLKPRVIPAKKEDPEPQMAELKLKDIADVEYDENCNIKKVKFNPTLAANEVLSRLQIKMTSNSDDIFCFNGQIYEPDGELLIDLTLCKSSGRLCHQV
jgi:hypothetical protein